MSFVGLIRFILFLFLNKKKTLKQILKLNNFTQ